MKEDSLKKRYFFKVISKLVTAPIMLAMQALIPRGLGPAAYGQFTFLTNILQQIVGFFDSGTSLAFYTRLSKNLKDRSIIRFYGNYIAAAFLAIVFFSSLVYVFKQGESVFPGQKLQYVWMAIVFAILTWISESVYKVIDAYGLTVSGEKILVGQRIIGLVILAILYVTGYINLVIFFVFNYFILLLLTFWWVYRLYKNGISILRIPRLQNSVIKEQARYFWSYSSPLLTYSFLGMLVGVFDNWLLIKMSGSVQQGYFGLAFKLSSISFLFSGAMTQLITREFSIAHGAADKPRIANLFRKYIPMLFVFVSFLSVFFAVHAEMMTYLFGGADFKGAVLPIAIMSLYPIHQTYGQLSGSLFYATDQTRLYRNIAVAMMPVSLFLTYLLIAPRSYGGFELGAIGLAIKTLGVQFIGVNVQLYFNAKYLSLSFMRFLAHQFIVVFVLLAIGFATKYIFALFVNNIYALFIASGVLYSIVSLAAFYIFPKLISSSKEEINTLLSQLKGKFILKKNQH